MAKDIKSPFLGKELSDPRFSEKEVELLSKIPEDVLKMFRLVFYQKPLSPEQKSSLKSVLSTELIGVLKRIFLLPLDPNAAIFLMPSRWDKPKFDIMLLNEVKPVILGRQMAVRFLRKGLERLEEIIVDGGEPKELEVDLEMGGTYTSIPAEEVKVQVVAMQEAREFLESSLLTIYGFSSQGKKTIEDIASAMRKNSAQ